MSDRLNVPEELDFLIEKRETEERRKSDRQADDSEAEHVGEERRAGQDRRPIDQGNAN